MKSYIKASWKSINLFNNLLLPVVVSFIAFSLALCGQRTSLRNSNKDKEIQYITSLKVDLKKDINKLDSVLNQINITTKGLDTALEQMQKPMTNINSIKLNYILIMKYDWFPSKVNFTEGTISQLKYTGNLGLISDPEVADSIALYDVGINLCHEDASTVIDAYKETFSTQKYVYNYKDRIDFQSQLGINNSYELQKFSNDFLLSKMKNTVSLVTTEKNKIIACYNDFANYQASLELYHSSLRRQKRVTNNLISLIELRYKINK